MRLLSSLFTTTIFLFFISTSLTGNTYVTTDSNYSCRLYQSFQTGNMTEWVKVQNEMNSLYQKNPSTQLLFSIAHAQYGYIGYLIGAKKTKDARNFIAITEKYIEELLKTNPKWADVLALKAALLAYNIALSPYKAPFIGPQSMSLISEALAHDSKSLQANIEKANASHYAPSMFGGNPLAAIEYYKIALRLMTSNDGSRPTCSWLYLNTITQLALAYEKAQKPDLAEATYKQIIQIAPEYKWVKDELYPKFKKKKG